MEAAPLAPEVPPLQGYSKAFARRGGQAEQAARQAEISRLRARLRRAKEVRGQTSLRFQVREREARVLPGKESRR